MTAPDRRHNAIQGACIGIALSMAIVATLALAIPAAVEALIVILFP